MRTILLSIAAITAAACGGKRTIPATPEIKASAGQAQTAMSSTTTSTQASIGLSSVGTGVVDAALNNQVATLDVTTLPDPASMAAAAARSRPDSIQQSARTRQTTTTASPPGSATGCIERDAGTGTAQQIPAGVGTCTAADHLEITYDSGDKVSITWSETSTTFDLHVEVTAGSWTGTSLRYQGSRSGTSTTASASVVVTGAMKYSKAGSAVQIDADFDVRFDISVSDDPSVSTGSVKLGGTATDHIALVRARQGWTLTVQRTPQSGTTPERITADWNGGVGIDLLKADGTMVDHSVAFNLNVHVLDEVFTAPGISTSTVTVSAGGDIEWDGAVVGTLLTADNQLYVHWTDGAEGAFDSSSVLGELGKV